MSAHCDHPSVLARLVRLVVHHCHDLCALRIFVLLCSLFEGAKSHLDVKELWIGSLEVAMPAAKVDLRSVELVQFADHRGWRGLFRDVCVVAEGES